MNEYNRKIANLLQQIEDTRGNYITDIAYDLIYQYCDNIEEIDTDLGFDFTNAVWGIGEETLISKLEKLL